MQQFNSSTVSAQEYGSASPTQPTTTIYYTGGLGIVFTICNCLFAGIIITALLRSADSAVIAIIAGVIYFAPTTLIGLDILSGTRAANHKVTQEQITIREANRLDYYLTNSRMAVDPLQAISVEPADQPTLEDSRPTYVPAIKEEHSVAHNAVLWAMTLYDKATGEPDPTKVSMAGIREPAGRLGRGGGPTDPAVKQFLLEKGVLKRVTNGIALNVKEYQHVSDLRWLNRQS